MNDIRQARCEDIERIAEIVVFNYRLNFYPIFRDDSFYFEELRVSKQVARYADVLDEIWVYDDGVVKGFIQIEKQEVKKLFVEPVLQGNSIGAVLLDYAITEMDVQFLWALEKNVKAIEFYKRHGFHVTDDRKLEEDTAEYLVCLKRGMPNMNEINIRKATSGDEKILAYIQTESWKAAFAGILSEEDLVRCTNVEKAEDLYRNVLHNHYADIAIEYVAGEPHCIAAWSSNRDGLGEKIAELICIHSLRDKWHCGYGSFMMCYVLEKLRQADFSEVVLWVFERNARARSFYEKHGFVLTDRKKLGYGAVELMYSKKL